MVPYQGRFNYWSQLAILLGLVGLGFIISGFITVAIGVKAMGGDVTAAMKNTEALQAALLNPANSGYAQAAQIAGTFFMMFAPSLAFILICHKKLLWAGFSKHFNLLQILLGFFIMLLANYMAGPFEEITKKMLLHFPSIDKSAKAAEDLYAQAVASMSNLKGGGQFVMAMFVIAFFPAVFEEMLFRGVLQNFLTKWFKMPVVAIITASLLFSLIHASYYLFLSRFILGLALGFMFYYTKNIWVNIFAHFINNLIALTVLFYTNINNKAAAVNQADVKLPIWSILITGAILYGLFVLLIKVSKENRNRIALKENLVFSNEPLIAQQ
jgi:uncharacterized protein